MNTKVYILILFIVSFAEHNAQTIWEKKRDSLALISRNKADKVLEQFSQINYPKLLYSMEDKYYYLIIGDIPYKEYYIELDDIGNINKVRCIKSLQPKNRKQRKLQKQYQKLLAEAEPVFDLNRYHTEFITKIPDAKIVSGGLSYFVLKDIDGKRYGEYYLSSITLPLPINSNLWVYLIRRLSNEITQ